MNTQLQNLKTEKERIQKEIHEKIAGYILAALGLIAGLAWNDAIKSVIEYLFPLSGNPLLAKTLYALILTIIITFVSIYFLRLPDKEEKK